MRIPIGCFAVLVIWASRASAQQRTPPKECNVDTAAGQPIRLYLSPIRIDSVYRLTPFGYSGGTHVEQNILDFTERGDSARVVPAVGTGTRRIDTWNAVQFVSPPLAGPFELGGFFSGRLELISNKQDFDFRISLYELTPSGDYVLSSTYSTQANAAADLLHRPPLQLRTRQYRDYAS